MHKVSHLIVTYTETNNLNDIKYLKSNYIMKLNKFFNKNI